MRKHEGLIVSVKGNGKAKVIIGPDSSGIPGASRQVNRHVCHCATDGSTLMIEALNKAGAVVGDRVIVKLDTSGLLKNAAVLLGIPLTGLTAGIAFAAVLTHGFAFHMIGGIVAVTAAFLLGIGIAVSVFKRVSSGGPPVIDQIVEPRESTSIFGNNPCARESGDRSCDSCSGHLG